MCANRLNWKKLQVLREVPAFRNLSVRRLAKIDPLVDEVSVPRGHVLVREGSVRRDSFIVVSGLAEVARRGRHVGAAGPGAFIGEVGLRESGPATQTVTAATPMRLLAIGPAALSTLLEDPAVSRAVLKGMVARLRDADHRVTAA
jgi:CRP-like cAMP-binding protein